MQCMKCGRDVEAGQVFCEICLADMEKYPVKPGTVVTLPHYQRQAQPKKTAKRVVPLDEQLRKAKKRNRILALVLVLVILAAAGFAWLAASLYIEYDGKFLPGQNYSAVGSDETTEAPSDVTEDTAAAE